MGSFDEQRLLERQPATFIDRGSIAAPELGPDDLARLLAAGRATAQPRR